MSKVRGTLLFSLSESILPPGLSPIGFFYLILFSLFCLLLSDWTDIYLSIVSIGFRLDRPLPFSRCFETWIVFFQAKSPH